MPTKFSHVAFIGYMITFLLSMIVVVAIVLLISDHTDWLDTDKVEYMNLGIPPGAQWSPPGTDVPDKLSTTVLVNRYLDQTILPSVDCKIIGSVVIDGVYGHHVICVPKERSEEMKKKED